jgi:hypothetical protein
MSKFFKSLPENLEQYNPEAIPKEWHGEKTFDEEGKLHSYNDLPIKVKTDQVMENNFLLEDETKEEADEFRWYKHGKLYREGNKPPVIQVTESSYATLNEDQEYHSYEGKPANIITPNRVHSYLISWWYYGKYHRKGNLPADIVCDTNGSIEIESYYTHGVAHRENNLPCYVTPNSKAWMVQGIRHNSEGPGEVTHDTNSYNWILYGVDVTKKAFTEIKALSNTTNMPIWGAFLLSLELVTQDHLKPFMNSDGKWETSLPSSWILNCWNITENTVTNRSDELEVSGDLNHLFPNLERNPIFFTALTRVLQFEENESKLRAVQVKEKHA